MDEADRILNMDFEKEVSISESEIEQSLIHTQFFFTTCIYIYIHVAMSMPMQYNFV